MLVERLNAKRSSMLRPMSHLSACLLCLPGGGASSDFPLEGCGRVHSGKLCLPQFFWYMNQPLSGSADMNEDNAQGLTFIEMATADM